jgi:diaminopropionate ammonia-lyase
LAAAVVAHLWEALGPQAMPTFVLVEPDRAACLYASAMAGKPTPVYGALDTVMAGLACGEVSQIAWRILAPAVEFFMTIPDEFAIAGMRLLAAGGANDPPLIAGESATAGLAGLLSVACETDDRWRKSMRLDRNARVLLFGTEGATDPQLYERLIGTPRAHARRAERA